MVVRLDVQVLAAHGAEAGAVGPAEHLVGDGERELVTGPGADVEVALDDVLGAELGVRPPVDRLVLLRLDLDVEARRGEAADARPVEARPEAEAEDVARWTTSSAGVTRGVGSYGSPPKRRGSSVSSSGSRCSSPGRSRSLRRGKRVTTRG